MLRAQLKTLTLRSIYILFLLFHNFSVQPSDLKTLFKTSTNSVKKEGERHGQYNNNNNNKKLYIQQFHQNCIKNILTKLLLVKFWTQQKNHNDIYLRVIDLRKSGNKTCRAIYLHVDQKNKTMEMQTRNPYLIDDGSAYCSRMNE